MRKSVADFFRKYSIKHEGFTPFMYCDALNLVTTGIGNLIDSGARNSFDTSLAAMAPALALPWKFKAAGWTSKNPLATGNASQADIQSAFITCKLQEQDNPGFNKKGGFAYAGLTPLTLDLDGIATLVTNKMNSNNGILVKEYPGFESLPADAQLGLMSMAWAMGAAFWPVLRPRPNDPVGVTNLPFFQAFKDAIDRLDFDAAGLHSQFQGGGSATDPKSRNHDLLIMFKNAAVSMKAGANPDLLTFPGTSSDLNNPGIASNKVFTTGHAIGAALTAGLFGFAIRDWWKDRKS